MVQFFTMSRSRKNKGGIVYSTNPDFFTGNDDDNHGFIPPEQQQLRIFVDRSNRKGKTVTLITGFTGNEDQLKSIEKELKTKCASGGSLKDKEIILQGDFRTRAEELLR